MEGLWRGEAAEWADSAEWADAGPAGCEGGASGGWEAADSERTSQWRADLLAAAPCARSPLSALVTCTAFFPSLGPADEPAVAAGAPYPLPALVPSPPPLGIVPAPLAPCRAAPLPAGAPLSMASRRRPTGGGNGMRGRLGRARDGRGGFRDGDVLLRRRAAHVPAMAVSAVAGWGVGRLRWLSLAAAVGSLRLAA